MSSQTERTVAVVGMGHWGKNLVRNFHSLGALATVCDVNAEREPAVREQYPEASFCRDYPAVLASDVPAVVLATPAVAHFRMAEMALDAGKDVFVEKPLSLTVADGEHLVDLAERGGRILMVGHILQYHPAITKMSELLRAGALGRILYVYSSRLNIGKIRTEENILWSFAPHDISVMLSLLDETPQSVSCQGASFLHGNVADVTLSQFVFLSGVRAHVFVSWLHPFKEQRLVVVGMDRMAVFDDTADDKLVLYSHKIEWRNRIPTAVKAEGEAVDIERTEPLRAECEHFLHCVATRERPRTDGREGVAVLRVLAACQHSLEEDGAQQRPGAEPVRRTKPYFLHPTSVVDDGADIGEGTKIWHFSHVLPNCRIGKDCRIGQNVAIGPDVSIGDGCKVQNNVSVYKGVTLADHVFCGPSAVFTNVHNPRSEIARMDEIRPTPVGRGATIGANATIMCGNSIGEYAFIGAGSVVTKEVLPHALVYGNPAVQTGWICACAASRLEFEDGNATSCPACGRDYVIVDGFVGPAREGAAVCEGPPA